MNPGEPEVHGSQLTTGPLLDNAGKEWHLSVTWKLRGDRFEPVAVNITAPAGEVVTADAVRKLAIGTALADQRRQRIAELRAEVEADREETVAALGPLGEDLIRTVHPLPAIADAFGGQKGTPLNRRDLSAVAAVYTEAHRLGDNPKQAVAQAFGISVSGAAKRIKAARTVGLLGPATPGKAG